MPNAADMALDAGFSELLANAGDSVTFRGATVSAVVNFAGVSQTPPLNGIPNLDDEQRMHVEIPVESVASIPLVGEILTVVLKGVTWYGRTQNVRFMGQSYLLTCEVKP